MRKKHKKLTACAVAAMLGLSHMVYPVHAEEVQFNGQEYTGEFLEVDETAVPMEESTEPEATPTPEVGEMVTAPEEDKEEFTSESVETKQEVDEPESVTQEQAENKADKEEFTSEPAETEQEVQPEVTEQAKVEAEPQEQAETVNTLSSSRANTVSIGNASQLKNFRDRVNNGEYSLNATLTADIDMKNEQWGKGIGYTPPATGRATAYIGTFDGKGHTITNINISGYNYNGFFGVIGEAGIVRNLRIYGSVSSREGGFVRGNDGIIENCAVYLNITATGGLNGGIAGFNGGTIRNCIYGGQISQADYQTAAIVGWEYGSTTNCYYVKQNSGVGAFGSGSGSAEEKSSGQFASGEVAWLLNGEKSDGVWKQTIGTDGFPGFTGETVYKKPDGTFSNNPSEKAPTPTLTTTQTASSITVNLTNYQSDYGQVQYKWDNGEWGTSNTLSNLSANASHTVSVRYMGQGNYTQSDTKSITVSTNTASYTITIPAATLEAGKEDSKTSIAVDSTKTFDLGYNGHVDVTIKNDTNVTTDAKLKLKRTGTQEEITSALFVNDTALGNINKSVATFKTRTDTPVTVSFAKPTETDIPAGTYNGTLTFEVSYSEQ